MKRYIIKFVYIANELTVTMIDIVQPKDPRQALRVRRFLMAFTSYLLWMLLFIICHYLGLMRTSLHEVVVLCGLMLLSNLFFYGLFISGINQRFKDPSLTIGQMVNGILWVSVLSYFTQNPLRGSYIALYLIVFIFGIFRLQIRQFFVLSLVAAASYGTAAFLLLRHAPDTVNLRLEITRGTLLLAALSWFSPLGHYIRNLRAKVIQTNMELKNALSTIEQLAVHDELTNVHNRRQMFHVLGREKAFADRTSMPFVVCLMD
ncbi:MAG: GGDEF domain-containing protein, partial [Thermodesulfobacteriota bacterium]